MELRQITGDTSRNIFVDTFDDLNGVFVADVTSIMQGNNRLICYEKATNVFALNEVKSTKYQ